MSWDVLLQKFPTDTAQPADVPDDYAPPSIGCRTEVSAALRKLLRGALGGEASVTLDRAAFAMEIGLGEGEPCSQLLLHVSGDVAEATKTIWRITEHFGLRAIDCSTSEFIAKGRRRREVSDKERADEARYRQLIGQYEKNPAPPSAVPLSGLKYDPCVRCVYLSLLPGESPKQFQKAVYAHWLELTKTQGELPAGIIGPWFTLTVPDGQVFVDVSARRYPALVGETESDMTPRVEKAAALLHAFATATGRRSGEVEKEAELVLADGERVLLAQCAACKLLSNSDYLKKFKPK